MGTACPVPGHLSQNPSELTPVGNPTGECKTPVALTWLFHASDIPSCFSFPAALGAIPSQTDGTPYLCARTWGAGCPLSSHQTAAGLGVQGRAEPWNPGPTVAGRGCHCCLRVAELRSLAHPLPLFTFKCNV